MAFGEGTNLTKKSNKPDAANPATALGLAVEAQWRRVADLER
jgi:hypothetical protein